MTQFTDVITFRCSFLSFASCSPTRCFCLELGSNPLKSAGIDDGAFADLKRVSYIRIADTDITEIPKGKAQSSATANYSYMKGVWLSRPLSCRSVPKERKKK